ncbi:hypothetical protein MKW92_033784, partial [Papaver armeniacum]
MADNTSFNERIIPMDDHQLQVDPPGLIHEPVSSIKETVFHCGMKTYPPSNNAKMKQKATRSTFFPILQGIFPILRWGRNYTATKFKSDFFAGLTLASLSIPQSMHMIHSIGYANLAKLDPQYGLCKLFSVNFLSHAAIVGFMGGAAIVIGLQQLKGLLGLSNFTNKTDVVSVVGAIWKSVHHSWNPYNFVLWRNKSISIQQLSFNGSNVGDAAKIGLIAAVVALAVKAVAVGRSFASVKGYHLDGNKEMVAMGFMNIAGCIKYRHGFDCYISIGCLTRLLYFTPIMILASVILSALPGLIDVHEAYSIWKIDKFDFLACIGAFFGVIFCSVEIGLLCCNSLEVIFFGSMNQYKMFLPTPGVLVIRIDTALLCFANANFVKER